MRDKCEKCNGTGAKTDENGIQEDESCPECDGRGYISHWEED